MKKTITAIIIGLVVAGMVVLLIGNRKRSREQTESVSAAANTEVVMTVKAAGAQCSRTFTSNGVAQANSELNFVSEVSGRVVAIYVDKGSRVSKGTPLLKLDSELLEADYKASLASYEALKKDEARFTRSYDAGGVSSQQLDNIRTQLIAAESRLTVSKWKLDNATVKAPVAGTINNRFVETGALIAPSAPLFEIVDDSRLKLVCNVPESKVTLVKAGQKVKIAEGENTARTFTGTVRSVGVKTDRGLNYPVEIILDKDPELHNGMYLKVIFESEAAQSAILVPRKAVVGSVLSASVYVARDGKAEKRDVRLGEMFSDSIEILEGLEEGEDVIVAGLMNVSDGTEITVVNK